LLRGRAMKSTGL